MNSSQKELVVILNIGGLNFKSEHRIRNQVRALYSRYQIAGYGQSGLDQLRYFKVFKTPSPMIYRLVKLFGVLFPQARLFYEQRFLIKVIKELKEDNPKFLIAHNIFNGILSEKTGLPYVFDSNEYLPRQFDGNLKWRLTELRYRKIVLKLIFDKAFLITVEGENVANAYVNEFSIPREKILVVANMPIYQKNFIAVPRTSTKIRLIHHGFLVPERGLELLIEIAKQLGSNYELTLMGPGPGRYISKLKGIAACIGNITILDPVPNEQIVETLHEYDLGLVIFGSQHFHHKFMTVPNKFWECLQARIPVVVSPDSAMASYVREHFCGAVPSVHTIESYVHTISNLTSIEINQMKSNLEDLAFSHSVDSWVDQYADIISLHCNRLKNLTKR